MHVSVQALTSCCCVKNRVIQARKVWASGGMLISRMSTDEKERAISQYNRQRAKSRRKAAHEDVEAKTSAHQQVEIEPLGE